MVYRDVAVMVEAEIVRHFGATPAELGLKPVAVLHEENRSSSMFPVGLEGMPMGLIASVRKMRFFQEVSVVHDELLLQPQFQIDAAQGKVTFDHAAATLIARREGVLKKDGRITPALDLLAKAEDIENAKVNAMQSLGAESEQSDQELAGEEDEFGFRTNASSSAAPARVVAAPTANVGSLSSTAATMAAKKKKNARGKKKSADKLDDEDSEGGLTSASGAKALNISALELADGEMARVAMKHSSFTGYMSSCFQNLQVGKFLQNHKLGKALQGVTGSVSFVSEPLLLLMLS